MRKFALQAALLGFALALANAPSVARTPPPAFDHAPPGAVVQRQTLHLAGEATNGTYLAVVSRVALPRISAAPVQYQPYFTLYVQHRTDERSQFTRIYQAPGPSDALKLIAPSTRPAGAPMYFPFTDVRLFGAGALMGASAQQLVLGVHETGADCGGATLHVLGLSGATHLTERVSFQNACALNATISAAHMLILSGPYYNATAALCCPTKPKAVATVRYANGRWTQTPRYFKMTPGLKAR